jgi:hypothetical protein
LQVLHPPAVERLDRPSRPPSLHDLQPLTAKVGSVVGPFALGCS